MTTNKILFRAGLTCLIFGLTACGTTTTPASSATGTTAAATAPAVIEAALPLIRTGASVATGAVLDFAVQQNATRTRLANEMYAAANAVYSLSGGAFPAPAQFQAGILAFGGSQADANYAQFSTAIEALYAAYYPKLVTGDSKTASDLLNAIAGGIEDATASYVTTPVTTAPGESGSVGNYPASRASLVARALRARVRRTECDGYLGGSASGPTLTTVGTNQGQDSRLAWR